MYQPKMREEQVRQLYVLAKSTRKPMTQLIREAVDEVLPKKWDLNSVNHCPTCAETACLIAPTPTRG